MSFLTLELPKVSTAGPRSTYDLENVQRIPMISHVGFKVYREGGFGGYVAVNKFHS